MSGRNYTFIIAIICLVCACDSDNNESTSNKVCEESSIWRDHDESDNCSFYNDSESCDKIIGKLKIIARLHKGAMEPGVFEGGMSSRWYQITKSTITYFNPYGEIADKGVCDCKNGVLTVDWENRFNRKMEYKIYFNSKDQVELRYFDYPFDFGTLKYDSTSAPNNPTKILGTMAQPDDKKQKISYNFADLEEFNAFQKCDVGENDTTLSHSLFEIGFSKNWTTDNVLQQGLDISYINEDSVYHGFMLSALPYQDAYFKKNKMVNYVRFKKVRFKDMAGVYLVRNDLIPRDNTVYWRGELRLHDPEKQKAFYLVFGIRSDKNQEPDWCIFSPIINSFEYK